MMSAFKLMSAFKQWGVLLLCWLPIMVLAWYGWHFSGFYLFLIVLLMATASLPLLLQWVGNPDAADTPQADATTDTGSQNE